MEVHFTPDQELFVRQIIGSGRVGQANALLVEALGLWEERERERLEIVAAVGTAEASLARGEGRRVTSREEVSQLADDIKRRGLARLAAGAKQH